MRKIVSLLLLLACALSMNANNNATWLALKTVNKYWESQAALDVASLPTYKNRTEQEWIAQHLSLVTHILSERNTAHLTPTQITNRKAALHHLAEYAKAGSFPQNIRYSYRTPIFIDEANVFCAVGYLIKTSGHEIIAREISAANNLAYVQDMQFDALTAWANQYGFTKDELAWIQPAYPPSQMAQSVGGGVQGKVYSLYAANDNERLYVGGSFNMVDGQLPANNIAYVTEDETAFTWHALGAGVNGEVNAIKEFDGKLFVAGHFTEAGDQAANNVAYWDGTAWHDAGCTYGTINDLIVYKGELYASGDFDVCAALSEVNFAKWTGTLWQQIPGLEGNVNTMEVVGENLYLGGTFSYNNQSRNAIIYDGAQFQPFLNAVTNEVMDFEAFNGTVHAACKITNAMDTTSLLAKLVNNTWESIAGTAFGFVEEHDVLAFNALRTDGGSFMVGGSFMYSGGVGTYANNCLDLYGDNTEGKWFLVDSAIYDMTIFKGNLFVGGKFMYGGVGVNPTALNSIAFRKSTPTSIPKINQDVSFDIYPNPLEGNQLTVSNSFGANAVTITNIIGNKVFESRLSSTTTKQQISIPQLSAGIYLVSLKDAVGRAAHKKIVVK